MVRATVPHLISGLVFLCCLVQVQQKRQALGFYLPFMSIMTLFFLVKLPNKIPANIIISSVYNYGGLLISLDHGSCTHFLQYISITYKLLGNQLHLLPIL